MSEMSRTEVAAPQRATAPARRGGFDEFYAAELPRLVALARGLCPAPLAEDVAQEASLDVATGATTELIDAGHCVCLGLAPPTLTWSPDGSVVAIGSTRGGARSGVVLVEPDGSFVEALHLGIGNYGQLAWQPLTD